MTNNGDNISFTASAAIVNRLGDELIKNPETAFFELVKNSYDADATEVEVEFLKADKIGGKIIIRDNGSGMSVDDLRTKWARAGGENKVQEKYSPKFQRRRLGAKGIGRFSVKKLGNILKVSTRKAESFSQLSFRVDFNEFTDEKDLRDMEIDYETGTPKTGFSHGTILEISGLNSLWGKREIKRIRSQLCHLIDVDRKDQNFHINFNCRSHPELSGVLENPITGKESHRVTFGIDNLGEWQVTVEAGGKTLTKIGEQREPLGCGPVSGILRYYLDGVKSRDRRLAVGTADESHMGVKVYRDGCRVRPYGEESDDWLEVKALRARGGGKYYIQPRALGGSVYISANDNPELIDATNREAGIIENEAFSEFQFFVQEHIELLNQYLEQEIKSEARRRERRTMKKILDTIIKCLNKQDSDIFADYVHKLDRSQQGEAGQSYKKQDGNVTDIKPPSKDGWRCLDCGEPWRVLKGETPSLCMDLAVDRAGTQRLVNGCGSSNIERATREMGDGNVLSGIVSGEFALIDGKVLRIRIDPNMGSKDDEYLFDGREIVINENHPAFSLARNLDDAQGKRFEFGGETLWPAQTLHVTKCVCLAWAELHYHETGEWEEFKRNYATLQESIYGNVSNELGF